MQQGYMPGKIDEFVRSHPGRGVLRVQVGTGRGTFPVKGALVRVSKVIGGTVQEFYRGYLKNTFFTTIFMLRCCVLFSLV